MKKLTICFILVVEVLVVRAQSDSSGWSFNTDVNFYSIPHDFFVLPVVKADKNKLHLEARYNYEDMETFSGWVGWNFNGGDDEFSYIFTPMLGGVVGLSNGVAPGLEFTLTYKNFELYSEMENLFDLKDSENNYYYNWADLTYSPTDWLWLGISGQRTRLYQTDLDIQRGVILGGGIKNVELTTYTYNIGTNDFFLVITLSANF